MIKEKMVEPKTKGFTQQILSFAEKALDRLYQRVSFVPNHIRALALIAYLYFKKLDPSFLKP